MSHLDIKDHNQFVRDTTTGAVLLKNRDALDEYIEKKRKAIKDLNRLSNIEQRLDALEQGSIELLIIRKKLEDLTKEVETIKGILNHD